MLALGRVMNWFGLDDLAVNGVGLRASIKALNKWKSNNTPTLFDLLALAELVAKVNDSSFTKAIADALHLINHPIAINHAKDE
jgi:hypothetical protein